MNAINFLFDRKLVYIWPWVALSLAAGCSGDEGVAPEKNHAPELVFTVDALAVPRNSGAVTLTVDATDPDDDAVTVTWEVTRDGAPSGALDDQGQPGSPWIRWTPPAETGWNTITVTASDGRGGAATIQETIQVGTFVQGRIAAHENPTWAASDSPFIIQPRFVIDERATLTIEAGCELFIDIIEEPELDINVVGRLETHGTAQAPVVIRPNSRSPQPGQWDGITSSASGGAPRIRLSHTDVLYATEAVRANETAEVFLDGCRIMFALDAAVLHRSSGELRVENSVITRNLKSGIRIFRGVGVALPATVVISGDSIGYNGDPKGQIFYTDQAAIFIDIHDEMGAGSAIEISHNDISRNEVPAIQLVNASYPEIHYNAFFANELHKPGQRYHIKLDDGFGGISETIDARDNFWGAPFTNPATDSLLIKEMIRDSEDGHGITVRLFISPWLTSKP